MLNSFSVSYKGEYEPYDREKIEERHQQISTSKAVWMGTAWASRVQFPLSAALIAHF